MTHPDSLYFFRSKTLSVPKTLVFARLCCYLQCLLLLVFGNGKNYYYSYFFKREPVSLIGTQENIFYVKNLAEIT